MIGEMNILDKSGDTRIQFRKTDPEEVAAAEKRFGELKAKGFLAYKTDASGKQAEVLHKFDPTAERIIFTPASIGG